MELDEQAGLTARDSAAFTARRLTCGDAGALQVFYRGLSAQSHRWFKAHALDDATVMKAMQRSEQGEDLTLGLFDGEQLVGYFFLWYFHSPVPLLGIGLADEHQGRGLGRPMIELLIEEAKQNGNDGIELTTMMDNDRAFVLYQKTGFQHHGDVENLQGDGSIVVERAMFLPLKPDAAPSNTPHEPPV